MPEEKPIVYILRGDDREAIEEHIRTFYNSLGASDMADLNTIRLEGKSSDLNDLRSAALAMPFLTERRLVIVEDALKLIRGEEKKEDQEQFIELLGSLPQSTALVLVAPDTTKIKNNNGVWETYWVTLGEKHWLIKWAIEAGSRAYVVDCLLPTDGEMAGWIKRKAGEIGGTLTPKAVGVLAQYVGNNTQRAALEIVKLLTYVNFERPVNEDDVSRLTVQDKQSDIFELVDAIGIRNGQKAQEMLHLLLEEIVFVQLFAMIIRQFRLILQAREIIDEGGNVNDIAKKMKLPSFVARKIYPQAQLFDLPSLELIYHQLLEIDLNEKTGVCPGDVALDILIARVASGLV